MDLSEENLTKQSSLSFVKKSLPHILVDEKPPVQSSFTGLPGRDIRRKSVAARKSSQNFSVTNSEELRDSISHLAPPHANEDRGSATPQTLSRLQAKVSSYSAFASVHKLNRADKRREVSFLQDLVRSFALLFLQCVRFILLGLSLHQSARSFIL